MAESESSFTIGVGKEATPGATDRKPLVQVIDLHKRYHHDGGQIEILNGVNLSMWEGDTLAIVGASGIGKSTLLHLLGTLDRPDSGKVLYREEDVFRFDKDRLAKFRNESIGFIFQFHHLLPEFNAVENAMMPALIQGFGRQLAREAAAEILIRVGLKDRLFHRVAKLSGGEQQRVALARSLVLKPAILLADEPTGNLDQRNSEAIHKLLLELNQEYSMTMAVVTHNMQLASLMERCVTISNGQLEEMR